VRLFADKKSDRSAGRGAVEGARYHHAGPGARCRTPAAPWQSPFANSSRGAPARVRSRRVTPGPAHLPGEHRNVHSEPPERRRKRRGASSRIPVVREHLRTSPWHDSVVVEHLTSGAVVGKSRQPDGDRRALPRGLSTAEPIEVGGHVAGAGVVGQNVGAAQLLGVLDGDGVAVGLRRRVSPADPSEVDAGRGLQGQ
jgi:hypothetical protein